ncbi:Gfo/Idh/MocA family protein [Leekyejoonella antrihumi]|uniref:Gfo/Idh/MocA family oxidoreductase n=1 Tax=Leekyejoonella antrihumi TaxID=1660198 RepID=A0A563E0K6_9MICO|nr:Gfo/Idh/MocA family oxidoreductase [Leekyejoonella antrihumi]TWP35909.1 Gfo/Idh/MocA family oxidoreductase [Leekyejoonella antrihumi]
MANLRAGLIGLGMMGRHHARVLGSLGGVDLVAVADPGGDKFGVAGDRNVVSRAEELIAVGLDYCVVAVPTAFHEEVGTALAEAGVHTIIEKPLAENTEAAERLVRVFSDNGLIGGVGHIERYNPALQAARARIEGGDLGEVYQVVTRRQGPFPGRIADVGVVMDLGTHDIDLTAWVTQQEYTAVSARTAHKSGRPHEDLVAVVGQLSKGTVTNHLVNWLSPLKERTTVITGEKGTFVADTLTADLTFYANGQVETTWDEISRFRGVSEGDMIRYAIAKPEPLRTEHENFRDAVLGKRTDIVTLAQGLATVRTAEACITSAREGRTVSVGPTP